MNEKEQLNSIKDCLHGFIVQTTKGNAEGSAVQILPELVKVFIELADKTRVMR